jgi:hypothetical protein
MCTECPIPLPKSIVLSSKRLVLPKTHMPVIAVMKVVLLAVVKLGGHLGKLPVKILTDMVQHDTAPGFIIRRVAPQGPLQIGFPLVDGIPVYISCGDVPASIRHIVEMGGIRVFSLIIVMQTLCMARATAKSKCAPL